MHNHFQPDGMNIELTTQCPLHCHQCYCTLEGGKNIPLEIAKKCMEEASKLGVKHVELSGGETMCYPYLYEIIEFAKHYGITPSIAISGWHFDDSVLNRLIRAGIGTIYVSLNGPTEDLNSKTRDGFALAINALDVLKRNNFGNTVINWVMHRESVDFLPQMIVLAENYHVGAILIIEPKPTSHGELDTYPTAEQIHTVANMVKQNKTPVELIVQHCFSPLLALSCENKLWGNTNRSIYKGCTAGLCSYCINVDGDFIPCRHLNYPEHWASTVEYWEKSPLLQTLRSLDYNKKEPCLSCKFGNYCRHCLGMNRENIDQICIGNEKCPLSKQAVIPN